MKFAMPMCRTESASAAEAEEEVMSYTRFAFSAIALSAFPHGTHSVSLARLRGVLKKTCHNIADDENRRADEEAEGNRREEVGGIEKGTRKEPKRRQEVTWFCHQAKTETIII
jgi:hypothetical protein